MKTLTRSHLTEAIYNCVGLSHRESSALLESVLELITDRLVAGESVKLNGFGTFSVRRKSARIGRNPKTKEEITIEPHIVVSFRPSTSLKKTVATGPLPHYHSSSEED